MATTPLHEITHPYYAEQGNYYAPWHEAHTDYPSWQKFVDERDDADLDMNLLYRWDWHTPDPGDYVPGEEVPSESLRLFYVGQRRADLWSVEVFGITREQEPEIRKWLAVRAKKIQEIWEPFLTEAEQA